MKGFAAAKVPIVFVRGLPGANVSFKDMIEDREKVATTIQDLSRTPSAVQAINSSEAASRLASIVQPQVRFASGPTLPFFEKTIGKTKFYFLTNPDSQSRSAKVEFDEQASPELWDPWTGNVQQTSFVKTAGHVQIDVDLPPFGSELVAFNESGPHISSLASIEFRQVNRVNIGVNGWSVDAVGNSKKGVGIQIHLQMPDLVDWLTMPELRTFSGNATYVTHFSVSPEDLKSANRVDLNLGEIKDAAEVRVNGADAGELVVHPFSVDVRQFLHSGENEVAITVFNSLTNYVSAVQLPKSPLDQRQFPHRFLPVCSVL